MNTEDIYNLLKEKFADAIKDLNTSLPVENIIEVDPLKIMDISLFLRDDESLMFNSLMNLSGVDDANGEKVKDSDGDDIFSGGTLSVFYHLHSISLNHKVTIKCSTSRDNPVIESVESVWKTANWHEREAFDMYGIKFLNHPDLRRILMPYDWDSDAFPLRKDYKNPEFYQGMKVNY